MRLALLLALFGSLEAAIHCDKEYNQIESFYERGYDITCQGLAGNFTRLLQELDVTNEISLRMENCTLPSATSQLFRNVRRIKHLHLENSTFGYSEEEPVFRLLDRLEDLRVVNTKFKVTKSALANLRSLKVLTLVNNDLDSVEEGSFADLAKLVELHVAENRLVDLNNVPLCELKALTSLNVSRNNIGDLNKVLLCDRNSNASGYQSSIELYQIDLSYNKIQDLSTSFAFLKFLRNVNVRGNRLKSLNNSYFTYLDYLESLRADNNSIKIVENDVFKGKQFLERLDLSKNQIEYINLKDLKSVKYLNLAHNKINIATVLTININNTVEELFLDRNNIKEIEPNAFIKYHKLKHLHLFRNKIKLKSLSFNGLINLKKLYINSNCIKYLPKGVFKDLYNLTLLDLSQNNLTVLEFNDTFASLRHLEVLNLSKNSLENLRYDLLEPLKDLVVLDISHNKLHYIEYDVILTNLPLLSSLDIKYNILSCELLSKIIKYLQTKGVSYTIQDKIDLDKINVGGIYCTNEKIGNNSVIVTHVPNRSVIFDVTLSLIIVLILVVLSIVAFRVHIYLKRRKYRADEFELIDE
ncbi:unnamed protein product [Phyllotreta striolata]|uniref:Uncharacterized protein n=1 Tax=Phyllotreta striolata TaxID=444603 RepID=A0A9N9TPE1_PHYSR|nr:unnamed protein product [Phyllotreta striolata]